MTLINRLPTFYANSEEDAALQGAFSQAIDRVAEAKEDCFLQLDVRTATWGLAYWEQAYAIQAQPEESLDTRRARLLAKMRGAGVATVALLKNVAESFAGCKVEIAEYPPQYRFEVKFLNIVGIPPNFEDLKTAIEEIKPAHLACAFVFIFVTHKQLSRLTHKELSAYTHADLRNRRIDGAYQTHKKLSAYRHSELSAFQHRELRRGK